MKYQPSQYKNVYLRAAAAHLPGPAIDNDAIDDFIAPLNQQSQRIKKRILNDNGIKTRHYGIDNKGQSTTSACEMAAQASRQCMEAAGVTLDELGMICAATSGADVLMPGFANMLQGELQAPPLETRSHHGICAAGVSALKDAANHIENQTHQHALVVATEYPSRLFKRVRYEPMGYDIDFNAHFLRWMLSDGAGAFCLSSSPPDTDALYLQLDWAYSKSFSGDYPVCMQMGFASNEEPVSFMDYPSFAVAEAQGSLALRQDIRLLPQLFEVGIHEYAELVKAGWLKPGEIDHFLCHYSSEKLGSVCEDLMDKAGLAIPRSRWYSNLSRRGNTGSASIFIMMADFLRERKLQAGETIFCFVPESGRFTVSYFQFTVKQTAADKTAVSEDPLEAPHQPQANQTVPIQHLLQELSSVWHNYRSMVWRTPLMGKIIKQQFGREEYLRWMSCWVPQVREGSKWMKTAANHLSETFAPLRELILLHSGEEQNDFRILFEDYRAAGGEIDDINRLQRNPGGEALNAFMYAKAQQEDAFGLLGGIYIIEGTGQRIIPALLPLIKNQVKLPENCFKFLDYHGENDVNHLQRWLAAVEMVFAALDEVEQKQISDDIVNTARQVAQLYYMQWELVDEKI